MSFDKETILRSNGNLRWGGPFVATVIIQVLGVVTDLQPVTQDLLRRSRSTLLLTYG